MQKTIDFLKQHKIIILISLITLAGLFLRLSTDLNELRNDEVATLMTASQNFPEGIINALLSKNLHAPLYYFILHFWIKLFGTDIFALRLLPILLGTLCIPISYLCTKKLSSTQAGILTALLVAINPFLIIFSNFAKFYALLQLLGFLSILFLIKTKENPKTSNIIMLAVVNALIVYTYVLGFLFVLIQFVLFTAYLCFKNEYKNFNNFFIKYPLILLLLIVPIMKMITLIVAKTQGGSLPTFWWYTFEIEDIYSVVYSWFSPGLPFMYMKGALTDPTQTYLSNKTFYMFIFNVIPLIIASLGILKTLLKKNFVSLLFYISFLFIIAELIGAILGKFAFCSRYTILAFPAIIIATAYGLSLIKKTKVTFVLILVLCLVNFSYENIKVMKVYNTGASELKAIAEVLKSYSPKKTDFIIMPFRGYYLKAFYNTKNTNFISFDINYSYKINDKNILKNILDGKFIENKKLEPHKRFNDYLRTKTPSKQLSEYIQKECLNRLNKNDRVFLIIYQHNNFSILDKIINDENYYKQQPMFTLLLLKINYDLITIASENLQLESEYENKSFTIYIYKNTKL